MAGNAARRSECEHTPKVELVALADVSLEAEVDELERALEERFGADAGAEPAISAAWHPDC